uniref:ABC1 atypical kinase-like domain-containing protein n=1 Tax=Oryza barthii TaxID=65489 RepID=A0A0D3EXJ4_9ORYZ
MPLALAQLQDIGDRITDRLRPWSRSAEFWVRAADIYTSYKVCQLRAGFVKDEEEREAMWEQQHELGAQKMYSLCSELGGLFLKAAQILGKPDLAPMAWVKRLVTLCDKAPATPIDVKYDINFDLYSATKEMEKQICYEFDFVREAKAMERIREFLRVTNKKKPPVIVPRVIPEMVSREVLVMEFIEGTPIMNLGNEMAKRGIDPGGKIATMAKQKILTDLTLAYGQMILKDDPHPGNILICKNTEARLLSLPFFGNGIFLLNIVALLDYGQVKAMPEDLRLAYANLVIAMADDDFLRTKESFREIGIETWSIADNELEELFQLSLRMFDTRLPPGVTAMSPFAEDSSLNKVGVQSFPEELFSVLRTIQLLRGLTVGMGLRFSCAQQWKPIAEEALLNCKIKKAAEKFCQETVFE